MQHSMGDRGLRVLGRTLPLHSPSRHYYAYRNTVLMSAMAQVPPSWKLYFWSKLTVRFLIYVVLAPQRCKRCSLIARGLRDGLLGRHGPIPS
jgi:rhamnosyltransferase